MALVVENDWSPSGQGFVNSRKQSLQKFSHNTTITSKGKLLIYAENQINFTIYNEFALILYFISTATR